MSSPGEEEQPAPSSAPACRGARELEGQILSRRGLCSIPGCLPPLDAHTDPAGSGDVSLCSQLPARSGAAAAPMRRALRVPLQGCDSGAHPQGPEIICPRGLPFACIMRNAVSYSICYLELPSLAKAR